MNLTDTYTINQLLAESPVSLAEVARMSRVSEKTILHIRQGKRIYRRTAIRVLGALSQVYGIELTLNNVTGINTR